MTTFVIAVVVLSIGSAIGTLDPTVVAVLGTIFGGVGLKVTEHWLAKSKNRQTEQDSLRQVLRDEIGSLKTELGVVEKDRDRWQKEYYDLRDKWSATNTELTILKSKQDN